MSKPSEIVKALVGKGYSEESANIISGQYWANPSDRMRWGTEEQTRLDLEAILKELA